MSARGRLRKVPGENPGAPEAKSQAAPRKKKTPGNEKQINDKKCTDAKASGSSKRQEDSGGSSTRGKCTAEPQTPKATKSGEKKGAPRSARKEPSTEEDPSKDLHSAPDASSSEQTQAPKTPKTTKSAGKKPASIPSARRGNSTDSEDLNKVLQNVLETLKVKKCQRSESSKCVNDIKKKIKEHLKCRLDWCKDIELLETGSYYENVKICEPNEFDVMITVPVERAKLLPFSEDHAFYIVEMKRHKPNHPLYKFISENNIIKASEMLGEFREKIQEVLPKLPYDIAMDRKKKGCPAVTMVVTKEDISISIDFVLGLEVHSIWPLFTQEGFKIETWLSKKVKQEQKNKPFYLVPKYEGRGTVEQDGIKAKDTWRISFSHVEKYILKNHGNTKTCCEGEQKCCRKKCLKLLKYLLQRLKEAHPGDMDKFYSYHAKTTLLHACANREKDSEWEDSNLSHCFQQLLMDFVQNLRDCQLPNFFIPSQNLFSGIVKKKCNVLADYIEYECNNGFPLLV